MLSSPDLSFSQNLPLVVFNQLGELLQQMAQSVESSVLVLTESVLARVLITEEWQSQRFTLVVSEQFSALLRGALTQEEQEAEENPHSPFPTPNSQLSTSLTFNSEAIADFVNNLKGLFASDCETYQNLDYYSQILRPNDATLQSRFTLLLLEYLLPQKHQAVTESFNTSQSENACQAIEIALQKQISQERLLNQVTTQIRKSLDLPVIMATAIAQVREFLKLDRLVIYKFERSGVNTQNSTANGQSPTPSLISDWQKYGGCIVYEVRATDEISSVLHSQETTCFTRHSLCWEKYRQGFTLVVEDVEKTYALEECLLNFLRANRVRAKLAAPIMFEEKLWGLLIAHQCDIPRQWTDNERNLLSSIAEQLAIAIHQSELMRSLTQEKQTLEQRVLERTMALRDALLAAEAASRLRNEFLATISHELLTPLTYVIGMSSTLLRWPIGELSQRQRDYLQTIHDSGEHLLEMINDILDLSQIEAGKTVLNINEFSLAKIAESAISALIDKANNQQVTLKLDLLIDPRRDIFSADAERIEQILWNLLTNAIKFTPEGGSVTLRIWVEDNTAVFQVEDTGIGISEEQLPLMFEKFQQLDTPYRRRYEGTGLGLALTKQLVELHRGRIEVESTVGIGSIFTVWIPPQSAKVLSGES
ncbi:GAF domain-containing sensor histidine kinase [Nostoc sp. FACHB-87]|uniref:GAF domain-containing sensor histidine kinase n=1 Tax=Nostocaceae TaxID=1162 RepID=UPI0016844A8A|nr:MULTISPECIES: GAF domain-containing sensor histidine kinase [Nostocaceae]MBD2454505.1 GAF domain-containing sensor histidine kinase [Nostoc sp. FACHB-87]MBD2474309.1 GAF domain-containing sensor histidine kinase [Anabaena sp. FACHB-83]